MTSANGTATPTFNLKGRDIKVRALNEMQIALMVREAKLVTRDSVPVDRKMGAIALIMDLLESAIIEQADRDYANQLNVAGELEIKDLMGIAGQVPTQDAAPIKPVVRRGRPRKTPV